jgi:conjugative relaxase-like TrwC/TraI family protein
MFSGIPQKNRAAAETYFDEHLSHNDYYTQGEVVADGHNAGRWIGLGAERLGLAQGEVVTRDSFLKLCDNQYPDTGKQLTPQNFKNRRIFFDFVCSPPKSVSVLAVTMNDQRIVQAHQEASTFALRELETFAAARIRKNGIQELNRTTGNVIGAAFMHTTSRALDPQLHTHFVLFNSTWDSKERRWKALQTGAMFGAINYATEVYRNELAKRLHQIGYQTRKAANGFEIDGIEQKLIERFSKRSRQRDMAVKRQEAKLGRKLTKKEVAHVVHQSRPKKLKGASDEMVRQQHLGEIGFFEKRTLHKVVAAADGKSKPFEWRTWSGEALDHGIAHVFERNSVVPQHRILETALAKGCGQLDLKELKGELSKRANLVRVGDEFSTREILEKELFLIRTVNVGLNIAVPFVARYEPSLKLGADQSKALAHVLTSTDKVTGFRGLAGSGKSTALVELSRVLHNEGYQPTFCAPTASAVDTLRKDNLEAVTLAKFLSDPVAQMRLSHRSVIVLDEAGAVGLNDMAALFHIAHNAHCRVVFSGDTGQHASVARGDALRILEQYSGYRFSELTTIRRQKSKAFRQVVELAAAKETDKAFAKLVELGAVSELPTDHSELYQRAADAYLAATKQGKSALLVSPTWAEIEAVTEKVRDTLKAQGSISQQDETVTVFDSLSWTEAQKKNLSQYEPGQRLRFVRRTKHFDRGETVEVGAVLENGLRVRRADGSEIDFIPASTAASFDVGEARELKVAAGDWLLLQANAVAVRKHFINGERVQVREIRDGCISLADGRILPADYNAFTHGYAVTSHSSQGKTVDEVLLVASSKSFAAVNREQFYVSISRGRERAHVFTDDADLLGRRVTDSHERKAAIELQDLRDGLAKLGFIRHEQIKTENSPPVRPQQFRAIRMMRETGRVTRATRLPPVQRLAQVSERIRRWLNELSPRVKTQATPVLVKKTEALKQPETIASPVTREQKREDLREKLRQDIGQHRKQQQNRSRGIQM